MFLQLNGVRPSVYLHTNEALKRMFNTGPYRYPTNRTQYMYTYRNYMKARARRRSLQSCKPSPDSRSLALCGTRRQGKQTYPLNPIIHLTPMRLVPYTDDSVITFTKHP